MDDAATGSRTKAGKGCMMKFGIVSDSSCDLAQEYTEKEKVTVVRFTYPLTEKIITGRERKSR